jgi:signal transduction histidine kinase/ligand-binding sensor domain-containing protein
VSARRWCGLAVLLLISLAAASEAPTDFRPIAEFHHTTWTGDQGSPGDTWAIAQTPDGWLWLGGPRGLFRFDGVEFEPVSIEGRDPGQSPAVYSLLAEESGDLWVGYIYGGITRIRSGSMQHYGVAQGLPDASVVGLARDAQGVLWAATVTALLRLEGERWHEVGPELGFTDNTPTSLQLDARGTLWIASVKNVFRLRRGEQRIEHAGVRPNGNTDFMMSPDGRLWYGDEIGVHLLPDQLATVPRPARTNSSRSFNALFDEQGHVWETVGEFARHPIPNGAREFLYENSPAANYPAQRDLMLESVHTLFEDREGNIWVCSNGGVDRFRPTNVRKLNFSGAHLPSVALAAGDAGTLWIGAHYGTYGRGPFEGLWKSDGQSVTRVTPDVTWHVTAVERDPTGALWIGGQEGIWRRQPGGEFVKLPHLPEAARGNHIHAITVDAAGDPWVSVVQSMLYRLRNGTWELNGNLAALPAERPLAQARDANGRRLWFGYQDNRIAVVASDRVAWYGEQHGLQLGMISAIHVGRFTVVAGPGSIALFHDGRFHTIAAADEPSALEGVTGIVEAHDGDLWLNSFRGAIRIAARDLAEAVLTGRYTVPLEIFDGQDGYPGEAQAVRPVPTLIKGTDDRLWFAGTLGIGWLHPRHVRRNQIPPPVQVRSAIAGDITYRGIDGIHLPKGTHDLQINYTALSLSRPEKVRFRYRLIGYDGTWVDAGTRRQAFYTNLRPGDYQFQVIAANERGVWNEVGAIQRIVIPPMFTQTNTFLALCVLAGLALVYGAYVLRIKQVTARMRGRLEERLGERERIARELHDTLLQAVHGLVLRLQITLDKIDVPNEARQAINDEFDRADALLIDGRDRVKNLRNATTAPTGLQQALLEVAAQMSSDSATTLRVIENGTPRELHPIVREEAARIATEAMLNAVRHAQAKTIEVEISYERRQLRLNIRDDGRGMEKTVARSGREEHFGIVGMNERAGRIRGRLNIGSRPEAGTEVSLTVPATMAYVRKRWRRHISNAVSGAS